MLFAGRERREFGMAEDEAGGDAGVGGDGFVAGVTGDDAGMRMADYASQNQGRGAVAVFGGELVQAAGGAIDNRAGRDAMNEVTVAKAFIAQGAWESGRACGDDLRRGHTRALECA